MHVEQSKYAQSYVKSFQQYKKIWVWVYVYQQLRDFRWVFLHKYTVITVGGFPSGGETVMNLVPLCHIMDMVCCQRQA